mmetsp:Transcript_42128/g.91438  ORF Transcript_42128/g.91438 Transcript_42128/m.91438 type:complete len:811 (+) Transcript_42128:113-2545(+)
MPCIVRCFAVAFLPFCFSHRAADQSCLPDAKAVRAAPSLLAVSQHLQRKGAVGNQSKEAAVAPNDDLAQTLEDALSWEIKQIEKSMGEKGDEKPSKVMGVALNGKDDLRMLRGAVIIGFAGVALLFIVFCLMRKFAPWVYLREEDMELEPLGDGTASPATAPRFFANPHVTLLDWTRKVRQTTPEDEMAAAGLDGWAFLEFRRLIWRIFSVIGAMLAVVLLPMHYQAHKDSQMLDILSIFDIGRDPLPDWMLWVHAVMVWFVVGASSWTISMAQEHFTERRYQWLKEIPFPRANTVLVRNIPAMYRSDAALLQYFTNVFNDKDAVERAYVVRRTGQLPRQVKNLKAAKLEVLHAKQHWEEAGSEEETPEWFYLQRCQKRVKTITEEVAAAQGRLKDAAARGDPLVCTSTGFVTFNTELTARLASREQYTRDVTDFQISMPPDPEDVIYDNLADQEINSTGWNWAGVAAIWGVFTIWIPFVVLISSWTTFGAVQEMLPSLKEFVQQHPWLDKILTGVFATIALKVVLAFLPTALYLIIRNLMSVKSSSEAQILMQRWYGLFLVMFVLLVTSLSRGVTLTLVSIAQKPGRIFSLLADFLPSASHFYFNYMILGWTVPLLELARNANFAKFHAFRWFFSMSMQEAKEYSEPEDPASYGVGARMAYSLLTAAITFTFCSCSPLIFIFAFITLALSQATYTYLVVYAEKKKPDTGGLLWVHGINQLFMVITIYILLMTGVLQMLSQNRRWLGPPLVALASVVALYAGKVRVDSLAFDVLPLEEVVRTSRESGEKAKHPHGRYLQPECDPDLLALS